MNLQEMIPAGGLDALASQLGLPRDKVQRGAEALLPSIVSGFQNRAKSPGADGAGGLESELKSLGGGALADNVTGPQQTDIAKGEQLLGNIFGNKDVSRKVAGDASQKSGLEEGALKKMLPMLTMLVGGHLSKKSGEHQGGLGGMLGSVLGGGAAGGALGSLLGGGR
jgi:hypothetical protein